MTSVAQPHPPVSLVGLLLTIFSNLPPLHPSTQALPPLPPPRMLVSGEFPVFAFPMASCCICMLMASHGSLSTACSSRPLLSTPLKKQGSQAVHVNCPMNEGCTGECEENENSYRPFNSCIPQIFIENLLSAGALQGKLGETMS